VFQPGMREYRAMTAQPVDDYDPDDPVEILRALPARFHEQFLAEYDLAVAGARRPEQYRELHHLLRLWRLRAVAYSDPGYETRLQAVQEPRAPAGAAGLRSKSSFRTGRRGSLQPSVGRPCTSPGHIRPRLRDALVPR
jgi:Family of unknown function (DUF6247)